MNDLVIFFLLPVISYVFVRCFTHWFIRIAPKPIPTARDIHQQPVPIGGGVGIILATVGGGLIFLAIIYCDFFKFVAYKASDHRFLNNFFIIKSWILMILATIFLGLMSFWDDLKPLNYRIRLVVHTICGFILFAPYWPNMEAVWGIFLTVALINACNFMDGLNGMLMVNWLIGTIAGVFLLITLDPSLFMIMAPFGIIISAVIGLLSFNFPRASIFLGDVGSTFLGLCIAFFVYIAQFFDPKIVGFSKVTMLVLFPFGFFWFDVFITLLSRIITKKSLTQSYGDYLFHHLYNVGFSHQKVTLIYSGLTLTNTLLAGAFMTHYIPLETLILSYLLLQGIFFLFVQKRKKMFNTKNGHRFF